MKHFCLILMIGFLATSISQATTPFLAQDLGLPNYKPKNFQAQCADFNGRWVGTCQNADGATVVEMNIQQKDCEWILMNSTFFPIGGTHQENNAIPAAGADYLTSSTSRVNWSANGQTLISHTDYYVKQIGKGLIYQNDFYGALAKQNGKLYSEVVGRNTKVNCTFELRQ